MFSVLKGVVIALLQYIEWIDYLFSATIVFPGASVPDPPLSGGNKPTVTCSSTCTCSLISAVYGCSTTHFNTTTCQWPEAPSCPGITACHL